MPFKKRPRMNFAIAKKWKQTQGPSMGEWINKMYTHRMEYYSALKKKNEMLHAHR